MKPIDADMLKNEIRKVVFEIADSPMPNEYASTLAVKMGELFIKKICDAPVINVELVQRGKWIWHGGTVYTCSVCNTYAVESTGDNYCYNCGAKMDLEE